MGLKAAVSQLDTDATQLDNDQAKIVADNQQLITDQGAVTADQATTSTDDAAIVAALTAGPNPAFIGPDPTTGAVVVYRIDASAPAGFDVETINPAG